jgi:hypothetical protein
MPPELELWIEHAVDVIIVAMLVLLLLLGAISIARVLTGD